MPDTSAGGFTRRDARNALVALTLVNTFNYLDRYLVPGMAQGLATSELNLTDGQFGSLASAFLVVYALTSPVFGNLGDRGRRLGLIAVGVVIWSAATALGALAVGFFTLLLARATVGVGEAAYGTIAPSVLADAFPANVRARIFSVFYAAIPVGSALGYAVGGYMDDHFGWRAAFLVAGIPGLLLAAALLRLREPARGAHDPGDTTAHPPKTDWRTYGRLLGNAPYRFTVLGYAAYTFAFGGIAVFMPKFLASVHGLTQTQAGTRLGGILIVTGFLGTAVGGWLADRMLRHRANAYLLLSGVATLLAAPFAWLSLTRPEPVFYLGAIALALFLMFLSTGPINSAIVNVVAPTERASAMALSILAIHALGDVPSPMIIGVLSDLGGGTPAALQRAVMIVPVTIVIGGVIWLTAAIRQPARAT
jgi:MFS family permease